MLQPKFSIKTAVTPHYDQVVIEGELGIQNAKAIHTRLMQVLNNCSNIKVIFENVTTIDLAVLQLIVSFYKTCVMREINVSLDFQLLHTDVTSIIEKGGFADILSVNIGKPQT